jgi:hypothetical protein
MLLFLPQHLETLIVATVLWIGNGANVQQQVTITVTAVATGAVLTVTINTKAVSYTCLVTDTPSTAAAALYALLSASTAPPEFQEITWTNTTNVITATATVAGTPFAGMANGLSVSGSGGGTMSASITTPNVSQSDILNPDNWLRLGANVLPQPGDDMVIANSTIPILWNIDQLTTSLNSYTRWQNFTGTIGLPEWNPNGYYEYRAKKLKLNFGSNSSSSGSSGGSPANVILGVGQTGNGPSRERYDFGSNPVSIAAIESGSPADDYAITVLGTAIQSLSVITCSVGVAMNLNESAIVASAQVDGGGTLALGPAVTFSGTLTVSGGTCVCDCVPSSIIVQGGGTLTQSTVAAQPVLTYPSILVRTGSSVTWLSGSNITNLVLQTNSSLDKSQDLRPMQIGQMTIDADTCSVNDPYNTITWSGRITLNNNLNSGPIVLGNGRQLQIF